MYLCFILQVVCGFAIILSAISFVMTIDAPEISPMFIIVVIIAIVTGCSATELEKQGTITDIDIVQMEITKMEIAEPDNDGINYYITVGNKYIIKVDKVSYAEFNVGDVVEIEIVTKTIFGTTREPKVKLKG